jgi:hypothetical protein
LHTNMIPGVTFKQWLLSGPAHMGDGSSSGGFAAFLTRPLFDASR